MLIAGAVRPSRRLNNEMKEWERYTMGGIATVLYGAVVYILFLATFLYAIAFVGDFLVPKTIDSGVAGPFLPALIIDLVLLGVFAAPLSGSSWAWARRG